MAQQSQPNTSHDGYFDNVNAPPPPHDNVVQQPPAPPQASGSSSAAAEQSKAKRLACALCRKRKLRCDQIRPKCGTCARLGHECRYDEVRRKSGPKRGYVKALEARLAQVETLLRTTEGQELSGGPRRTDLDDVNTLGMDDPLRPDDHHENQGRSLRDSIWVGFEPGGGEAPPSRLGVGAVPARVSAKSPGSSDQSRQTTQSPRAQHAIDSGDSWEMIALGLEEPLPMQELQDELHVIYFDVAAKVAPMVNRARYFAAMDLPPNMRPPICLRYAIWCHAASAMDKHTHLVPIFYQRARKYLEADEMRGFGQSILTLAHCQTWVFITMHEFRNMYFPRAWMSTGRAIRLAQMMSLHRVDGSGLDVKQTLVPPRDETEKEERRRTFWFCFWTDRCASIGTGWPMTIDEKDIMTNLPGSDDAFQNGTPSFTYSLEESLKNISGTFSAASGAVIMACLFGRNLIHLHRPDANDHEEDINGKFWQRHRALDTIILDISMNLPDHLRLTSGSFDPTVVFLNLCLHTSVICLHQAAIYKAEKHRMAPAISGESKLRCIGAAAEIASIMRIVATGLVNPFIAFCLYVAARVFVQFLRARPTDLQVLSSLHFLHTTMGVLTKKNAIVESFMAQLELDMEVAGIERPASKDPQSIFAVRPDRQSPAFGGAPRTPATGVPGQQMNLPIGTPKPGSADEACAKFFKAPSEVRPKNLDQDQAQPERHQGFSMFSPDRGIMDFNEHSARQAALGVSSGSSGRTGRQNSDSLNATPGQTPSSSSTQPNIYGHDVYGQASTVHTGSDGIMQQYPAGFHQQGKHSQNFFGQAPFGNLDDITGFGPVDPFKTGMTPGPGYDFNMPDQDPPISVPRMTTMGQDWEMGGGNAGGGTGLTPCPDPSWSNVMEAMQGFGSSENPGASGHQAFWMGSSGI